MKVVLPYYQDNPPSINQEHRTYLVSVLRVPCNKSLIFKKKNLVSV